MVGAVLMAAMGAAVWQTNFDSGHADAPTLSVRELGHQLMGTHAAALLVVGVLLTVALLGATILAATDRPEKPEDTP